MTIRNLQLFMILFFLITIISCDKGKNDDSPTENEIPKALKKNESYETDLIGGSFSRRSRGNMIEKLYEEAKEKDAKLKDLDDRIYTLFENQGDSLYAYENYSEINKDYWSSANSFAMTIGDSILRKEVIGFFNSMESDYKQKMKNHDQNRNTISTKSLELEDRLIAMKLIATLKMMKKYQENEIPRIGQLENLITNYNKLIEESKNLVKIEK